jgi:hypothetical protein
MIVCILETIIINFAPKSNIAHFNYCVGVTFIAEIDCLKTPWCYDRQ